MLMHVFRMNINFRILLQKKNAGITSILTFEVYA